MASEIRVDTSKNTSGLCTVTYSNTGAVLSGITTGTFSGDITGDITGNVTGNMSGGSVSATTGAFSSDVILTQDPQGFVDDSAQPQASFLIKHGTSGSNRRWVGIGASLTGAWLQSSSPGGSGLAAPFWINKGGGEVRFGTYGTKLFIKHASAATVGIGTDDPDASLEIYKGSAGTYLKAGGDNGNNGRALTFTSSATSNSVDGGKHTINATSAHGELALATTGTERILITKNGDVGIGTDSPGTLTWRAGYTLDVFGGSGNVSGHLYLGANRGDGVQTVGSIVFYDNTQTASHQNVAIIEVDKIGSGTNTRGGDFLFYNKVAGGTSTPVTFKIRSGGNCEIPNGNLTFASGHGIDFSSTGDGSGTDTSELFDDYEEGTWLPTLAFGGGSTGLTYNSRSGSYVKIGSFVYCVGQLDLSAKGSSTGSAVFGGLPYTAGDHVSGSSHEGSGSITWWQSMGTNLNYPTSFWVSESTTGATIYTGNGTAVQNLTHSDFNSSSQTRFVIQYRTAT